MVHLPPYTLTQRLHEGGETVIYKGFHGDDQRPVVIKTHKDSCPTPRLLLKLRHEHAILRGLDFPGVIKAYGLEEASDRQALVLEDFGGHSLDTLIKDQLLDLEAALDVGIQVADALAALHRVPVLHKDIKPHNILLNPETKQVKLIDFSIATRLSQEPQLSSAPARVEGTPAYMAPEQTGRMSRVVDQRSDLYSLGVTLYELLTGSLPFLTADPVEMMHSHLAKRPAPPSARAPGIPPIVSDIVMRLLAKAAEDRYQSAVGLRADLARCLSALRRDGRVEPFTLGEHDAIGTLQIPQKLYGRAAEVGALFEAFDQASQGRAGLALVLGYSGVGKSSLVREVHKPIAQRGGQFFAGKFDQYDRSTPCAPIARALRELCQKLLTRRQKALAVIRREILEAVGASGKLLIDLIPELELIVGPQPSVPELGPTESQNRFNLLLQRFLGVFATAAHPLVLFLDDLQWADAASLKLLGGIMTEMTSAHLLVIGAYRDNEVGAGHPLLVTLEELRKGGAGIREIALKPLGQGDVEELLADTLGEARPRVAELAELVLEKTHGNPFFMTQFLHMLHKDELLRWDAQVRAWQWSVATIRSRQVTDNVVDLMAAKIRGLSEPAQALLRMAACAGYEVEWGTLRAIAIYGRPTEEVNGALWETLREGLLVPLDNEYRFLHGAKDASDVEVARRVRCRFLHDRVHQAAYMMVAEDDRAAVHLRIGRLLRDQWPQGVPDEGLFEVAGQLNAGALQIEDEEERLALARLNARAGRRAKRATAYEAARGYFEVGMSLLAGGGWDIDYELALNLHLDRAECEYLSGRFEAAEALFTALLTHVRSKLEAARVHTLRILLYTTLGRFADVVTVGRAALSAFGVALPEGDAELDAAVGAAFAEADESLGSRRIAELVDLPIARDPDAIAVMQLLGVISPIAFFTSARLFALIVLAMVNLSMRHGNMSGSDYAYAVYAPILAGVRGRFRDAYEFGELGLRVSETVGDVSSRSMVHFIFGGSASHYRHHARAAVPYLENAKRFGLESGNFTYVSFYCIQRSSLLMLMGEELGAVREEFGALFALLERTRDALSTAAVVLCRQVIHALTGKTAGGSLNDETFSEERFLEETAHAGLVQWLYCVHKLTLAYLYGDLATALALIERARALEQMGAGLGHLMKTERLFYSCLALAALQVDAAREPRERCSALFAEEQAELTQWADANPEGYRHKQLLVAAEAARVAGREAEAIGLYEEAIAAARKGRFTHQAALASELASELHRRRGRDALADVYLQEAHRGYVLWGAAGKAQLLEDRYPGVFAGPVTAPESSTLTMTSTLTTTSTRLTGGRFDVDTVVRTSQAIASEIELHKVLEQVMRIVIESAGAQRGYLLLPQGDRWVVEAEMSTDPDWVRVGVGLAVDVGAELAGTVVRYVAHTREAVVLGNAIEASRFAADPYIVDRKPRSILCLALLHQGRLSGILYLENNAARDAFTRERIELLGILSAQAAIAIENARLYADLRRAHADVRASNAALEQLIEERTRDLRAATEDLRAANERLTLELVEREDAERARAALQEQVIRAQRERLEEMSTPVIPITDRVMVMPLIGTVDEERASRVIEAALRGAARSGAAVVILDVTGLRQIDANVTRALVSASNALRLLGAQAVLTGMRADMAQLMVSQGEPLTGIVTRGTLQSGIAFALGRAHH